MSTLELGEGYALLKVVVPVVRLFFWLA